MTQAEIIEVIQKYFPRYEVHAGDTTGFYYVTSTRTCPIMGDYWGGTIRNDWDSSCGIPEEDYLLIVILKVRQEIKELLKTTCKEFRARYKIERINFNDE